MGSSTLGFLSNPIGALTGGNTASAAQQAAQQQAAGAGQAINAQNQGYQIAQGYLTPYQTMGTNALTSLGNMQPFSFNASNLTQTPGYQFTLNQGERSLNNQYAARGLGYSGAQMMGSQQYATGLADQTYNQQLQNQLGIYQTNYGNLLNQAGMGMSAGSGLSNLAMQNANQLGGYMTGRANALASGTVGAANAQQQAFNNLLQAGTTMAGAAMGAGGGGGSGWNYSQAAQAHPWLNGVY